MKLSTILLLVLLTASSLWADGKATFVLGDVKVTTGGDTKQVKRGDTIPANAKIITGSNGRISIYDERAKQTLTIGPNTTKVFSGISNAQHNAVSALFANTAFRPKSITSVAGVRGKMMTTPCSAPRPYINNGSTKYKEIWKLYELKKYKEVIAKTKGATDPEGMFLESMSMYYVYGLDMDGKILRNLEKVLKSQAPQTMKDDAKKGLGMVHYDRGEFEEAMKLWSNVLDDKKPHKIDEFSYYMMIMLNRNMGREAEEKDVWKYADQFCKKSKLVQSLKK